MCVADPADMLCVLPSPRWHTQRKGRHMQSRARRNRISDSKLRLTLVAAGVAIALIGVIALAAGREGDGAASSIRQPVSMNASVSTDLEERDALIGVTSQFYGRTMPLKSENAQIADRETSLTYQHHRWQDVRNWSGTGRSGSGVPHYRFLEMNELPGDAVRPSEAPDRMGY